MTTSDPCPRCGLIDAHLADCPNRRTQFEQTDPRLRQAAEITDLARRDPAIEQLVRGYGRAYQVGSAAGLAALHPAAFDEMAEAVEELLDATGAPIVNDPGFLS